MGGGNAQKSAKARDLANAKKSSTAGSQKKANEAAKVFATLF
jgi:hypothetical protein